MPTKTKPIDLDKLKPSPESDALVAEALGLEVRYYDDGPAVWMRITDGECYKNWPQGYTTRCDGYSRPILPYSTDMTAAWEALVGLLDENRINGWCVRRLIGMPNRPWYSADLFVRVVGVTSAGASTAPMAICLAILKLKAAG